MASESSKAEHKYFTIRERVALGEIALYWLSGKLNPADVTTKALNKAVTMAHSEVISGQAPYRFQKDAKCGTVRLTNLGKSLGVENTLSQ